MYLNNYFNILFPLLRKVEQKFLENICPNDILAPPFLKVEKVELHIN
jgi:hypothetical protein